MSLKPLPCARTRIFDPSIHPQHTPYDLATIRIQIQKHPRAKWLDVARHFKQQDWTLIFTPNLPRMTFIKNNRLTSSLRIRLFKGKYVLNLSNGQWGQPPTFPSPKSI